MQVLLFFIEFLIVLPQLLFGSRKFFICSMELFGLVDEFLLSLPAFAVINEGLKQAFVAIQTCSRYVFYDGYLFTIASNKDTFRIIYGLMEVSDRAMTFFCRANECVAYMTGN